MKIGIDAKNFFNGFDQQAVYNLVKNLLEIDRENEYYIFLKSRDRHVPFPFLRDKVHLVYIKGRTNMISNVLFVPLKIHRLKLDIALFTNFLPICVNCKTVLLIYDTMFLRHPEYFSLIEKLYFSPIRFFARKADSIITISETEKIHMSNYGFGKPDKISVMYMGVSDNCMPKEKHSPEKINYIYKKYELPPEFLLYVGRINIRKNIDNLIRAVALIKNENIPLICVGKRDWKTININSIVELKSLKDRIKFLGFLPTDDLVMLFSLAKITCYVTFDEGFGIPPVESIASGVPVVVSNIPIFKETIKGSGTFVNPTDPLDIASGIDKLLSDDVYYFKKKTEGIVISNKYTWKNAAETLIKILQLT